uniref:Uncharacterized protein n=1 Tax=Rhizophora mucronata TaxID=61149 RepID=A0A2P2QN04_RHIMU
MNQDPEATFCCISCQIN